MVAQSDWLPMMMATDFAPGDAKEKSPARRKRRIIGARPRLTRPWAVKMSARLSLSRHRSFVRPLARFPQFCSGHGHIEMRAGAARNGVGDGIHHRSDRGGGAGLANAFDAERVGGRPDIMQRIADVG